MKYPTKPHHRFQQIEEKDEFFCAELQSLIRQAREARTYQILRLPHVKQKTGQANSTIWKHVKNGTLPPPVHISPRCVGWLESEINAVIAAKVFASRVQQPLDMKAFVKLLIKSNTFSSTDAWVAIPDGELRSYLTPAICTSQPD